MKAEPTPGPWEVEIIRDYDGNKNTYIVQDDNVLAEVISRNKADATEIEVGSEWVLKSSRQIFATVLFVDHKSVLFEYRDDWTRQVFSYGNFLDAFNPKPHTITVAGVELPEPLREAPSEGETYWITDFLERFGICKYTWMNLNFDAHNLKRGNAFRTEADAKAWLEFEVKQRGGEA